MSTSPSSWVIPDGYTFVNLGRCKAPSCQAEIAWCTTAAGRRTPVDRDGTSHFATCPDAATFRQRATPPRP